MTQIYAVGRSTSKLYLVDLYAGGNIRWESSFADDEDRSYFEDNTEPMFAVSALDEAVFAARTGTNQVKTHNTCPEAVGKVDLLHIETDK